MPQNKPELPQLITRKAAAASLGVNLEIIDRLVKHQELTAYRIGSRCVRLRRDELLAYLEANRIR